MTRQRFNIPPVAQKSTALPVSNFTTGQAVSSFSTAGLAGNTPVISEPKMVPPCEKLRHKKTGEIFPYNPTLATFTDMVEPYNGELQAGNTSMENIDAEIARLMTLKQLEQQKSQPANPLLDLPVMDAGE